MVTIVFSKVSGPYAYFAQVSTTNGNYYLFSDSKLSNPLEKSKENVEAFTQAFFKQDFQSFQKVYRLLRQKKDENQEYDKKFFQMMERQLEIRKGELEEHIKQIIKPYQDELDEINSLFNLYNKKSS